MFEPPAYEPQRQTPKRSTSPFRFPSQDNLAIPQPPRAAATSCTAAQHTDPQKPYAGQPRRSQGVHFYDVDIERQQHPATEYNGAGYWRRESIGRLRRSIGERTAGNKGWTSFLHMVAILCCVMLLLFVVVMMVHYVDRATME